MTFAQLLAEVGKEYEGVNLPPLVPVDS
jgi:hypothetical protein